VTLALCPRCGAPMMPGRDDEALAAVCPYCDGRGALPAAALAAAQLDGMHAALAAMFEDRRAFVRVQSGWLATAVFASVYGASQGTALGALFFLGPMLSFAFALAVGRAMYRRRVRPLLLAVWSERGAACRACGGDVPAGRGLVRCRHCGAHNVVGDGAAMRATAVVASVGLASAGAWMTRVMVVSLVATMSAFAGTVLAWQRCS
jgi:hypothetical protein